MNYQFGVADIVHRQCPYPPGDLSTPAVPGRVLLVIIIPACHGAPENAASRLSSPARVHIAPCHADHRQQPGTQRLIAASAPVRRQMWSNPGTDRRIDRAPKPIAGTLAGVRVATNEDGIQDALRRAGGAWNRARRRWEAQYKHVKEPGRESCMALLTGEHERRT